MVLKLRACQVLTERLLSLHQEFLLLLEKVAKCTGKEGLSCSRAVVINFSTELGSIGLCLGVLEAPMYPYRASKVRCQGRCWGCSAVHRACGGEPMGDIHLPQATLPGSPKHKHRDRDQQHPGLSLSGRLC